MIDERKEWKKQNFWYNYMTKSKLENLLHADDGKLDIGTELDDYIHWAKALVDKELGGKNE
jgi:hypothetical protein